jgi:hypothetical protein
MLSETGGCLSRTRVESTATKEHPTTLTPSFCLYRSVVEKRQKKLDINAKVTVIVYSVDWKMLLSWAQMDLVVRVSDVVVEIDDFATRRIAGECAGTTITPDASTTTTLC